MYLVFNECKDQCLSVYSSTKIIFIESVCSNNVSTADQSDLDKKKFKL